MDISISLIRSKFIIPYPNFLFFLQAGKWKKKASWYFCHGQKSFHPNLDIKAQNCSDFSNLTGGWAEAAFIVHRFNLTRWSRVLRDTAANSQLNDALRARSRDWALVRVKHR